MDFSLPIIFYIKTQRVYIQMLLLHHTMALMYFKSKNICHTRGWDSMKKKLIFFTLHDGVTF